MTSDESVAGSVAGSVAVVSGGASGIGAAVVARLATAGAAPVVWDVQAPTDPPTHLPTHLPARAALVVGCDVTDEAAVDAALDRTVAEVGVPSVLVTAAGIGGGLTSLVEVDTAQWDRVLAVNLRGTMLCLRAVARSMRAAGRGGAIVTVSSINGRVADRGMGAYCVSKAGVEMLTRVAAAELGADGIRVNGVAPGVVDTPLVGRMRSVPGLLEGIASRTPLGGIGAADAVAEAVLALLSSTWVTGQVLVVDGGLTLDSPVDTWGTVHTR